MMRAALLSALLVIAPAFASDPDEFLGQVLLDLARTLEVDNGLWIGADTFTRRDHSRHFRFTIIPNEYTGSALLEILLDPPEGENAEPVAFTFDYDGIEYPITEYVDHFGKHYTVYLPQLEKNTKYEFTLGLKNTRFHTYDVTALLTTDNGQKSAMWKGTMR